MILVTHVKNLLGAQKHFILCRRVLLCHRAMQDALARLEQGQGQERRGQEEQEKGKHSDT